MLDDGNRCRNAGIELGHQLEGRVRVVEIVIGQLLALVLHGRRHTGAPFAGLVERRALMRVLAVAQLLRQPSPQRAPGRSMFIKRIREPAADGRVVCRSTREGLGGQHLAQVERGGAAMLLHGIEHLTVVFRIDDHGDAGVVLGGRADHRRPADVDVLDAVGELAPFATVASNG